MEILSRPDLRLQEFVFNTMRAYGRENINLAYFRQGIVLIRDAVCFFGKVYTVSGW